jgi:flagellar biosynthetic protein FlhB
MAEATGADRKHPATERRRRQAREQGQVARSADLSSAGILLLAVLILKVLGPGAVDATGALTSELLGRFDFEQWRDPADATAMFQRASLLGLRILSPVLAALFVCAFAVNVVQTGPLLLPDKLALDWQRLDPARAAQRLVSVSNLVRLLFALFKLLVMAAVGAAVVSRWQTTVMDSGALEPSELGRLIIECSLQACLWIGLALLTLAVFDFGFQWWKQEQDLRMTDQELREEMRETEGDPQVNARRRQVQRQLANQRLRQEVPKADVIITNPTELAIALRYDPQQMAAPQVIAKGAGLMAQNIRRIALEHGVTIVERKPLAQALFKSVEVGQAIPLEHFQAVAEVLRYVYQLQGKTLPKAA